MIADVNDDGKEDIVSASGNTVTIIALTGLPLHKLHPISQQLLPP